MARLCCLTQLGMLLMGVCKVIPVHGLYLREGFTWSDLSNKKFVGVGFTEDTSRKILDLLTRLHQAPTE